jgi:hypothetical protein
MSDDGSFGVGAVDKTKFAIVEKIVTANSTKPSNSQPRVLVFNNDDDRTYEVDSSYASKIIDEHNQEIIRFRKAIDRDSIRFTIIDSTEVKRLSKLNTNLYYEGSTPVKIIGTNNNIITYRPAKSVTSFSFYDGQNPKPLIIINGKIAGQGELKTVNPNNIKSLDVLKGESAIETYGEQGENGVIIIKLKDPKSSKLTKASSEVKKDPWKTSRTEVNNVFYIDDEDPSKNSTLAYITKYTSDKIIDNHKSNLEKFGLKVKISKIKRNKNKEITSIKITISDEKGDKSSASYKDSNGISGIEFGKSEGALVVRTSTMN